ncbi:hypothetical protein HBI24_158780 [Parastagonospora nodorum]|nr:hypothetical protein HBI78_091200 [Parastagonospora nodorum]KAH5052260.1 hypothetical protein HBH96_162820 [Parastagonospora nodorum]KAH5111262.1 hypothetical protein HBH72_019550 [Parastagonospora nodorum]KAH5182573.1 hypothetical protein HBH77_181730 [Parastagonospora nodorum]KAH5281939.1 hypothetical protein HBI71_001410 [Parastagonospora nodorum]
MPNPTDSMTNRNPPQLELRVAELHMRSQRELHVDSEEAVQHERRRVSRELEPIHAHESSRRSSEVLHQSPDHASLRSRNASSRNSTGSHNSPRPGVGNEGTATDTSQTTIQSTTPSSRWYTPITSFWSTHISLKIDSNAHRDHLALERTFLGYLRTSLILVVTGVLTAQLFRLQHAANPSQDLGFYVIGRPLSVLFIGMGLLVVVIGALRFWRLQRGLVKGMALVGGWEVLVVMGGSFLLVVVTFALVLGVNIQKAMEGDG